MAVRPDARIRLNIGGHVYDTTMGTLTGNGKIPTFFSSLMRHEPPIEAAQEKFIDRDGDSFAPLLSYLRTGIFRVPPALDEAAVRWVSSDCIFLSPHHAVECPTCAQSGTKRISIAYLYLHLPSLTDTEMCVATGCKHPALLTSTDLRSEHGGKLLAGDT